MLADWLLDSRLPIDCGGILPAALGEAWRRESGVAEGGIIPTGTRTENAAAVGVEEQAAEATGDCSTAGRQGATWLLDAGLKSMSVASSPEPSVRGSVVGDVSVSPSSACEGSGADGEEYAALDREATSVSAPVSAVEDEDEKQQAVGLLRRRFVNGFRGSRLGTQANSSPQRKPRPADCRAGGDTGELPSLGGDDDGPLLMRGRLLHVKGWWRKGPRCAERLAEIRVDTRPQQSADATLTKGGSCSSSSTGGSSGRPNGSQNCRDSFVLIRCHLHKDGCPDFNTLKRESLAGTVAEAVELPDLPHLFGFRVYLLPGVREDPVDFAVTTAAENERWLEAFGRATEYGVEEGTPICGHLQITLSHGSLASEQGVMDRVTDRRRLSFPAGNAAGTELFALAKYRDMEFRTAPRRITKPERKVDVIRSAYSGEVMQLAPGGSVALAQDPDVHPDERPEELLWTVVPAGRETFAIKSVHTNQLLQVSKSTGDYKVLAVQVDSLGAYKDEFLWTAVAPRGRNSFVVRSVYNNRVLQLDPNSDCGLIAYHSDTSVARRDELLWASLLFSEVESSAKFSRAVEFPVVDDDPDSLVTFEVWAPSGRKGHQPRGRISVPLYSFGRNRPRELRLPLRDHTIRGRAAEQEEIGSITVCGTFQQPLESLVLPRPVRQSAKAWQNVGEKPLREQFKELEAFLQDFEVFSNRFMHHCDTWKSISVVARQLVQWDQPLLTFLCLVAITLVVLVLHEYILPLAVLLLLLLTTWYHPWCIRCRRRCKGRCRRRQHLRNLHPNGARRSRLSCCTGCCNRWRSSPSVGGRYLGFLERSRAASVPGTCTDTQAAVADSTACADAGASLSEEEGAAAATANGSAGGGGGKTPRRPRGPLSFSFRLSSEGRESGGTGGSAATTSEEIKAEAADGERQVRDSEQRDQRASGSGGDVQPVVPQIKERFENERRLVFGKFCSQRLRFYDPTPWCDAEGNRAEQPKPVEDGIQYVWRIEVNQFTDSDGWRYARHFGKGAIWRGSFLPSQSFVRLRRHIGRPVAAASGPVPTGVAKPPLFGSVCGASGAAGTVAGNPANTASDDFPGWGSCAGNGVNVNSFCSNDSGDGGMRPATQALADATVSPKQKCSATGWRSRTSGAAFSGFPASFRPAPPAAATSAAIVASSMAELGAAGGQSAVPQQGPKGPEFGIAKTPFHDMYQQCLMRWAFLQRQIEYWMDWYERRKNLFLGTTLHTQNFAFVGVLALLIATLVLPTRWLILAGIYTFFADGFSLGQLMRENQRQFISALQDAAVKDWLRDDPEVGARVAAWSTRTLLDEVADSGSQLVALRDWIRTEFYEGRPMIPLRAVQRCGTLGELAVQVIWSSDRFARRRLRKRVWYRSTLRNLLDHVPSDITLFQPLICQGLGDGSVAL